MQHEIGDVLEHLRTTLTTDVQDVLAQDAPRQEEEHKSRRKGGPAPDIEPLRTLHGKKRREDCEAHGHHGIPANEQQTEAAALATVENTVIVSQV